MSRGVTSNYFALPAELAATNTSDAPSINTAEAKDERGDFVARETFEALDNPTVTATVCADYDITQAIPAGLWLGELVDGLTEPDTVVTGWTINTAAETAPTITKSGTTVPTASLQGVTYTPPTQSVLTEHIAQILLLAFTFTGEGVDLVACSANATCNLTRGLDELAETCTWDVSSGKIEVTASFSAALANPPVVTPAADWTTTSPLKYDETNNDYEKYDITMTYTPVLVVAPV